MSPTPAEDKKRWYAEFEQATEEVVRHRVFTKGYRHAEGCEGRAKEEAAREWLKEKADQRARRETRRFRMVFWAAVGGVIVSVMGVAVGLRWVC